MGSGSKLSIASVNTNCAKNNRNLFKLKEEVELLLVEEKLDILCLTEVDFVNAKIAQDFNIKGFKTIVQQSENKVRTVILVNANIKFKDISSFSKIPSAGIEVERESGKNLVILSIYRQWLKNAEKDLEQIEALEDLLAEKKNKTLVMLGDFNMDKAKFDDDKWPLNKLAETFQDICIRNSLHLRNCGITFPFQKGGGSILDYFAVTKDLCNSKIQLIEENVGWTDHNGIKIILEQPLKVPGEKMISYRKEIQNVEAFKFHMYQAMNCCMDHLPYLNNDEQAVYLTGCIREVMDVHAPLVQKKVTISGPRPKLSKETLKLRSQRNKSRKEWLRAKASQKQTKHAIFKNLRNKVNYAIKRDKVHKVETDLRNKKNLWHVASEILGKKASEEILLIEDGKKVQSEEETANILNDFFVQKIQKLKEKINSDLKLDPLTKIRHPKESFSFKKVNNEEVITTISKLKKSKSTGLDLISSELIKVVKYEIAEALTYTINSSLETGNFPSCYKEAKITALWKHKGSSHDKSNYRPVSGLSTLGKIQEAIVNKQMMKYCEDHGILGQHQHGFRANRSTTTAIISSLIKWQTAKEKKKWTGCLLFDLSAAYDTISIRILIDKAKACGFDDTSVSWLQSYTSNRKQAVKVGQYCSQLKTLDCGVPQGSSISCLLFLLYIHDITLWISEGELSGYADDTLLNISGDNPAEVLKKLEIQSRNLFHFFASNELVANPSKTCLMMFGPKRRKEEEKFSVWLDENTKIVESESERILGVQVQNSLEWSHHVQKVKGKVNYGIATLRRLHGLLRRKHLKAIAEGIVMSNIRYGLSTFMAGRVRLSNNDPVNQELSDLQIKMNDMMRVILNVKRKDKLGVQKMLEKCEMLSLNQLICKTILVEFWKILKFGISSISKYFQKRENARYCHLFKTSEDPKSFISIASKLYEMTSEKFQETNLLAIAKQEAHKVSKSLPI